LANIYCKEPAGSVIDLEGNDVDHTAANGIIRKSNNLEWEMKPKGSAPKLMTSSIPIVVSQEKVF